MPIRHAAAVVALLAALAGGAAAAGGSRHAPPPRKPEPHQQMSLEQAVRQVQHQTNGRILAADAIPSGRNKLYRIKVLTPDGHVRVMQLHSNANPPDNNREKH